MEVGSEVKLICRLGEPRCQRRRNRCAETERAAATIWRPVSRCRPLLILCPTEIACVDWTLGWAVSGSAVDGLHASRGVALTGGHPGRGDLVDGGEVVCTEVDVHGGDVLLQVGDPPGARDRDYVGALSKDPGKGELAGRDAFAFGDGHHLVQDLEVLVEVLALEAG